MAVLAVPGRSEAQDYWGSIDITSDPEGTNCEIPTSGIVTMYVIGRPDLSVGPGAGFYAAEFDVEFSELLAAGALFVGQSSMGTVTQRDVYPGPGVQVGFPSCQTTDVLVYTVTIFWPEEPSGTFCVYVTPSTLPTGVLAMADCTDLRNVHPVFTLPTWATTTGLICGLLEPPTNPCPGPVPVAESTWGAVKALYRD
jgi:hypothetical protein